MIDKARPGLDKGGSNSSDEGMRDWKSWMKILFLFWGASLKPTHVFRETFAILFWSYPNVLSHKSHVRLQLSILSQ